MLIAEDVVLLSHDDETGAADGAPVDLDYRLAGALLVELALARRIDVVPEPPSGTRPAKGEPKPGTVTVLDRSPTGHPVLDEALAVVAEKDRLAKDLVSPLSSRLTRKVLEALAERGVLRREQDKVLGIFPVTRWPAADSAHETALRATLEQVLLGGRQPDPRTASLVALLHGSGMVRRLVPKERRKEAEARAKELARGDWASGAVQKAAAEVAAAVMTAVIIPAVIVPAIS